MGRPILRTPLCDLLGIEYPILSAGMGPSLVGEKTGAPVDLVVAVSEAGGLGVLGGAGYTVEELREEIRAIKARTDKPFGVDVLLPANLVARGDQPFDGPSEMPIMDALGFLPDSHRDWVLRIKEEFDLPDPVATIASGTTTQRPHAVGPGVHRRGRAALLCRARQPGVHGRNGPGCRHAGAGDRRQRTERRSYRRVGG